MSDLLGSLLVLAGILLLIRVLVGRGVLSGAAMMRVDRPTGGNVALALAVLAVAQLFTEIAAVTTQPSTGTAIVVVAVVMVGLVGVAPRFGELFVSLAGLGSFLVLLAVDLGVEAALQFTVTAVALLAILSIVRGLRT